MHRSFPVNFAKFLRTPFLLNTIGQLLLFNCTLELRDPKEVKTFKLIVFRIVMHTVYLQEMALMTMLWWTKYCIFWHVTKMWNVGRSNNPSKESWNKKSQRQVVSHISISIRNSSWRSGVGRRGAITIDVLKSRKIIEF